MRKLWPQFQQWWGRWKPLLSPLILLLIFGFLGRTLYAHWHEVNGIRIGTVGWACLAIATGVTLLAHAWTGWVWGWILQELGQPINRSWATQAYLKTNIAKYLPSNLLHLYGRTLAAKQQGVPLSLATLSVLLDTLLMVAGGLILGLFCMPRGWLPFTVLGVIVILVSLQPRLLKRLLRKLSDRFSRNPDESSGLPQRFLRRYPLGPLLGEMLFIILRGLGFIFTMMALSPLSLEMVPPLISIFSIGWVLGFITPGAPGGLGVFELTVSTLLTQQGLFQGQPDFSVGMAISAVAIHRVVNTFAEGIGAVLALADERWPQ
jgi:glycosyltransferase 2 family protein